MDPPTGSRHSSNPARPSHNTNQERCWMGVVLYQQTGGIQGASFGFKKAEDPFHAEALALLQCIKWYQAVQFQQEEKIHIFSDCKSLVAAINTNTVDDLPSWNAAETVAECVNWVQSMRNRITVRYARRQALKGPHLLANWARRNHLTSDNSDYVQDENSPRIDERISREFFLFENS